MEKGKILLTTLTTDGTAGSKSLPGSKVGDTVLSAYVENYNGTDGFYGTVQGTVFEGFISVDDHINEIVGLPTGNIVKLVLCRVKEIE